MTKELKNRNRIKIIISKSSSELTVIDEPLFISSSSLILALSSLTRTEGEICCLLIIG